MAKTYLIFGATGGVGAVLARHLAGTGAHVHIGGRDGAKAGALAAEIGGSFSVMDASDPQSISACVTAAGPKIDGLVWAIGSINLKPLSRLTDQDFLNDFTLNALGAAQAIRAALPALKASEGTASIVLFSTVAVRQGFSAHASVAMAKGAIEGLTLALAAELAPKIRVNAVAPSLTRTNMAKALTQNEQMAQAIALLHPLQRLGEPEDVAKAAAYLLGDDASWVTGQILGVDGGRSTLRTKG